MSKKRAKIKAPTLKPEETFQINGKTYELTTDMSFEQDMFVMNLVDEMGLDSIKNIDIDNIENDVLAKDYILASYRTGKLFDLLGAVMREKGITEDWTIAEAEANAHLVKTARGEARDAIRRNMVFLLLGFFVSGLDSSETFQKSSAELVLGGSPSSPIEAVSNSESGGPSSAPSPETTPARSRKSSRGPSVRAS